MDRTIQEILDNMTDEQQTAVYALIGIYMGESMDDLEHSDMSDEYLQHYGVIGMKWGHHRSRTLSNARDRRVTRQKKYASKADKLEEKALNVERKNGRKLYKLGRKELKYDIRGKERKRKKVERKIKKVKLKSEKIRYKVADIKYKMKRNQRIIDALNTKISKVDKKHADLYRKEIEALMKDQKANQQKLTEMQNLNKKYND